MTAFRRAALTVLALIVAASAHAQSILARGDVLLQLSGPENNLINIPTERVLLVYAPDGTKKTQLPGLLHTRVGLLAPTPNLLLSSQFAWVEVSTDASTVAARLLADQRIGGELTEIVPMRGGEFLIAQRYGRSSVSPPRLLRFNAAGEVLRVYDLELFSFSASSRSVGAAHMDLLSDQCTLVYTLGDDYHLRRVMRYDICAGQPMPDFTTLNGLFTYVGSIRQLPDGDVLIAAGHQVMRFDSAGTLHATYPMPALRIALTPDGKEFWAAEPWSLQRVELANPTVLADRFAVPLLGLVKALAVVGEWRAATSFVKRRPVRK